MKKTLISAAMLSAIGFSPLTLANESGDFLVRGGLSMVSPDSNKDDVLLDGAVSGLTVSVDDDTQLGLNFVYFYDKNWAIEVLASTPFTHDIKLHAGDETTVLGEAEHLPPTISALYYFDSNSAFKPYVGAGLNYTIFLSDKFTSTYQDAGFSSLDLDNSLGLALQVGADYQFDEKWSLNFSARYIDINTDASFTVGGTTAGKADVNIDPLVFSVLLGYTF